MSSVPAVDPETKENAAAQPGQSKDTSTAPKKDQPTSTTDTKAGTGKDAMSQEQLLMIANRISELEVLDKNGLTQSEAKAVNEASKKRKKELSDITGDSSLSADDKVAKLQALFTATEKECTRQHTRALAGHRRGENADRLRQGLQMELDKTNNARQKLADLCRGLQQQNKAYIEEANAQAELEARKREEQRTNFQSSLDDISSKIQEQDKRRIEQEDENKNLREKAEKLIEQYKLREQHYEGTLKANGLEKQLVEAKLAQRDAQFEQVQEMYKLELAKNERLTEDLKSYSEKFAIFQDTITKSTDTFATMKKEMAKAAKLRKQVEKDNQTLRDKTKNTDIKLLEMAEQNQELSNLLEKANKKTASLEKLCRELQKKAKGEQEDTSTA